MRIRVSGTGEECTAGVAALRAAPSLIILAVSRPRPNRGDPGVRVYIDALTAFTCPVCSRTSQHPRDAQEGYCAACHAFTGGGGG